MYTDYDFLKLNSLSPAELEEEISMAEKMYCEIQETFKQLEKEMYEEGNVLPKVDILIDRLKNVEWYIRRATEKLEECKQVTTTLEVNTNISLLTDIIRVDL